MKKYKIVFLFLIMCLIFLFTAMTTFGEWIKSEKIDKWLWIDKETNTIPINTYFWAGDGDVEKMYHASIYGFIDTNKQIDVDTRVNENGEVIKNGEIVTRKKESNDNSISDKISEDSSNILYAQKGESSGRLLKNYIIASQNVEVLSEKSINGSKKTNVITFKENGSFISLDTKKQNKLVIKCERDKSNKEVEFRLALIVNGEEEDSIEFEEDEYEVEYEFKYKLNDDVDLVMYSSSNGSTWVSKYLYITNGRMSKYKEEEEE